MKTQEQVIQEIANFTSQIEERASASGNSKAYISRSSYLTSGSERQSYNLALSQLKKRVKIEIADHKAEQMLKATIKATYAVYASEHTKKDLQQMAKEKGLKTSGTKAEIVARING